MYPFIYNCPGRWFHGMWCIDSFCEYTSLYEPRSDMVYVWGCGAPWKVKPIDWTQIARQRIMSIVTPD